MQIQYRFIVPHTPISKKNGMQIVRGKGGRPFLIPSKQYRDYEKKAIPFLLDTEYDENDFPIDYPCEVECIFYMPTKRKCDLTNMLEAIDDILVKAGILEDDNYGIIESHDGSRVLYDKANPRTEIRIQGIDR